MKFTGKNSHQGDTQWYGVTTLPPTAKKVGKTFIAKSERSGHAHALCGDYEMFEVENTDGFFVKVGSDGATLNHTGYKNLTPEYWDKNQVLEVADHKPTTFEEGVYFVGIQRRCNPFQKVWEKVVD
jgi:hypothetical protein